MNVFIAGHKGLVGSSLIRTKPVGVSVVTADRSEIDLTDRDSVLDFLEKSNIDTVILAAAKVGGIKANSENQIDFLIENLSIQNSVLIAALKGKVQNFIFLGSSCIYPRLAVQPISEDSLMMGPLEPTNEGYALAKIAGVYLTTTIAKQNSLNYFSVMPSNLYGPGDNFDYESSHVPAALIRRFHEAKLSNEKSVTIWGSGNPRREFLFVDDLAEACWHMLSKNIVGGLYNIGTGIDYSIKEFAEQISEIVGFDGVINYDLSKPDGTPQKLLNVSKIQELGWRHKTNLRDGLEKTYAWYVDALKRGIVRGN